LLVRYIKSQNGDTEELAKIYTVEEHGIQKKAVDFDARKIIHRLENHGYRAFIVGGAIRDLLGEKKPKDFDIVTDAHPGKIRKIFSNSRVIGRRFRLVHVYSGKNITEVSTFRSSDLSKSNAFGTMKEDVARRDFTMNALYYSPETEYMYDYVDGFRDIRKRKINTILPLENIFVDDPVRIIRAIRYSAITGFTIPRKIKKAIKRDARLLDGVSNSRLTEEVLKILQSGRSEKIFLLFKRLDVLERILPSIYSEISKKRKNKPGRKSVEGRKAESRLCSDLQNLDGDINANKTVYQGRMLAALAGFAIQIPADSPEPAETVYKETLRNIKKIIAPITPPNREIEHSARYIYRAKGMRPPQKKRYGKGRSKR